MMMNVEVWDFFYMDLEDKRKDWTGLDVAILWLCSRNVSSSMAQESEPETWFTDLSPEDWQPDVLRFNVGDNDLTKLKG